MENLYKGDSPSKKYARFLFWTKAVGAIGTKRFYSGKHLVLASWEAGDIATLRGLGVDWKNIIAVEQNPRAAFMAQEKYPEARIICGDALKICREYRRKLAGAYLDFCSTVSEDMVLDVMTVLQHGLCDDAYLGVTLQTGREKSEAFKLLEKTREHVETRVKRLEAFSDLELVEHYHAMSTGPKARAFTNELGKECQRVLDSQDLEEVRQLACVIREGHGRGVEETSSYITRLHYLGLELKERSAQFRQQVFPTDFFDYVSATRDSKGVPMCIGLFKATRMTKTMPMEKFRRKTNDAMIDNGFVQLHHCTKTEESLREKVLDLLQLLKKEWEQGELDDAGYKLRQQQVPLLFNVPKETVTAWKAHQTRGTYDREAQT